MVVAEADLVLGEDHPARGLAAELALVERLVEDRQERAGQRDRDGRAGLEVPRAADDLARVALPHVDLAHAQPVGVRMRLDLEHAADEEAADVAVDVRHADVDHALHLDGRREQPVGDLLRSRVDGDVLAEPGERRAHQNWLQQSRVVAPELAEIGDAVPEHGDPLEPPAEREPRVPLGVVADELEEVRVDHPRAADLDPARVPADGAARAVADVARDERLDRRLREREVVRDELAPPLLAEQRLQQVVERALEVAERDALVDGEALDLVERRRVRRVRRVAPVDAARA